MKVKELKSATQSIAANNILRQHLTEESARHFRQRPEGIAPTEFVSFASYYLGCQNHMYNVTSFPRAQSFSSELENAFNHSDRDWESIGRTEPHSPAMFRQVLRLSIVLADFDEEFANRNFSEVLSNSYLDFFAKDFSAVLARNGLYNRDFGVRAPYTEPYLIRPASYYALVDRERINTITLDGPTCEDVVKLKKIKEMETRISFAGTFDHGQIFYNEDVIKKNVDGNSGFINRHKIIFRDFEDAIRKDLLEVLDGGGLTFESPAEFRDSNNLNLAICFSALKLRMAILGKDDLQKDVVIAHESQHKSDMKSGVIQGKQQDLGQNVYSELRARINEFSISPPHGLIAAFSNVLRFDNLSTEDDAQIAESIIFYALYNEAMNNPENYLIDIHPHPNVSIQTQVVSQMYKMVLFPDECMRVLKPYADNSNNALKSKEELLRINSKPACYAIPHNFLNSKN